MAEAEADERLGKRIERDAATDTDASKLPLEPSAMKAVQPNARMGGHPAESLKRQSRTSAIVRIILTANKH